MVPIRDSPLPISRDSSPSTQRITTFPVSSNAPLVFRKPWVIQWKHLSIPHLSFSISSQHSVPILPSISPSYHLQGPSPSSLLSRLPPSSFSSSRLPSQQDPHMEALIDFYRERQSSKTAKTATIVWSLPFHSLIPSPPSFFLPPLTLPSFQSGV